MKDIPEFDVDKVKDVKDVGVSGAKRCDVEAAKLRALDKDVCKVSKSDTGAMGDISEFDVEKAKIGEIVSNDKGGRQSKISGKMTEVPPLALLAIANVMGNGSIKYPREKDGTPNWHKIDSMSNLDHALEHAMNFLSMKNTTADNDEIILGELAHHAARAMMALEMFIIENEWTDCLGEMDL